MISFTFRNLYNYFKSQAIHLVKRSLVKKVDRESNGEKEGGLSF